jgi:hypothetical protein
MSRDQLIQTGSVTTHVTSSTHGNWRDGRVVTRVDSCVGVRRTNCFSGQHVASGGAPLRMRRLNLKQWFELKGVGIA